MAERKEDEITWFNEGYVDEAFSSLTLDASADMVGLYRRLVDGLMSYPAKHPDIAREVDHLFFYDKSKNQSIEDIKSLLEDVMNDVLQTAHVSLETHSQVVIEEVRDALKLLISGIIAVSLTNNFTQRELVYDFLVEEAHNKGVDELTGLANEYSWRSSMGDLINDCVIHDKGLSLLLIGIARDDAMSDDEYGDLIIEFGSGVQSLLVGSSESDATWGYRVDNDDVGARFLIVFQSENGDNNAYMKGVAGHFTEYGLELGVDVTVGGVICETSDLISGYGVPSQIARDNNLDTLGPFLVKRIRTIYSDTKESLLVARGERADVSGIRGREDFPVVFNRQFLDKEELIESSV